jgi:hypothetical protein
VWRRFAELPEFAERPSVNKSRRSDQFRRFGYAAGKIGHSRHQHGGGVAWLPRPSALAVLFDLIEPRVLAQGSTTDGTLALDDGTTIWLTGSGGGGSLQLSGSGGYGVAASVASGVLSGTVSAPVGAGSVGPLASVTTLTPEPPNPNGTYEGTYAMTTSGYFRNVVVSTGRVLRDCGHRFELTGTLRLDVRCCSTSSGGFRIMDFRNTWTETRTILPPCPGATNFSPTTVDSGAGDGMQILSRKANDVLQFGIQHKFNGPDGATQTRVFAFVGAYAGDTTIPGTIARMANNVVPTAVDAQHMQGFTPVQTALTLQRR